ncbi:hypothetical protein N7522_004185 [Penicillium canescens]|nr:hypothetical protein N7522_004185 [Penicillium canescens]
MPERSTGIGDGKEAASRKINNGTEDPTCRSTELTCHDYTVGWICALPKEQTAATAMLDQIHSDIPKPPNDPNTYTLGCIGRHNIVITCLPKGKIGNNSAATSAAQMVRTFPSIKVGLMVGIGGGIPPRVRLGDVVISVPVAEFPGVVQWDIGKLEEDSFKRIGALNNPPTALLTALTKLETKHEMHGSRIRQYLDDLGSKYPSLVSKYTWSDSLQDPLSTPAVSDHPRSGWQVILFSVWSLVLALYRYLSGSGLLTVESSAESAVPTMDHDVHNIRRRSADVRVHYGLIASGNKVIKNAVDRDRLNESLGGNVLCVETEAAGLMDNFPCIVIRGICDYADAQKNKDWQEYAAAIAAACAKELLEHVQSNDVDGERPLKDILGDVNATSQRIDANVETIRTKLDRKEDLEILDWLTEIDYGPQHSDFLKIRQPGTGQWFLDSVEYQNWRSSSQQTLFGLGIPGAGKTTLAAIVIDDLTTRFGHDTSIGIAYIYFNFRQKQQQRREDLVSSLVKQLSQDWPSLPDSVENLYNKHTHKKTRPSFDELCKALLSVAAFYSKTFIIVDALDECEVSDGCLSCLLSEIFALQSKAAVNLFATSRPIPEIEERFNGCTLHHISASEEDIRSYLKSRMTRLPEFVLESPELQERVKAGIIDAVDGMFLLARLHLRSLIGMKSPKAIEIALKKLPKGSDAYDYAYDEAMERIKGQVPACRKTAEWTLKWITFAKRQLSVPELQHALAVEVGETEFDACNISRKAYILSICAGLVTVDEESNIIRLVHYTTQEYFERTRHDLFENAEADLSKRALSNIGWFLERLELNKFYDYSANHWGHHAREASSLCPEVTDFLNCEPKIDASSQAFLYYGFHNDARFVKNPGMTGLHLASVFGIGEAIKIMLHQGAEINAADQDGRTPLSWAAENGHELVVKLLINNAARLETKDDTLRQTPLSLAAVYGYDLVVKLLLDKGARLETTDDEFGQTPLSLAAEHGHDLVVKLLLDKGADLETKDDALKQTPLSFAAENGYYLVVKLLIDKGACLDTKGKYGQTPLSLAAVSGYDLVVKLLLDNGADPGIKDDEGQTPLSLAARNGDESVVELLLDKGADPETKD